MADENKVDEQQPQKLNSESPAEPNGKQDEDAAYWKSRSRDWERQARELKTHVEELNDAKEHAASESKRADDAQTALDEANRKLAAYEAANKHGIDAALLMRMSGGADDMESNAEIIVESLKAAHRYPEVPDNGQQQAPSVSKESIEGVKDPVQRVMNRAEHLDLYR